MTTQTRPDVDLLESLDFEPVCMVGDSGHHPRCDLPARWYATVACCGVIVLLCDPHKAAVMSEASPDGRWLCGRCGARIVGVYRMRDTYQHIERIR